MELCILQYFRNLRMTEILFHLNISVAETYLQETSANRILISIIVNICKAIVEQIKITWSATEKIQNDRIENE